MKAIDASVLKHVPIKTWADLDEIAIYTQATCVPWFTMWTRYFLRDTVENQCKAVGNQTAGLLDWVGYLRFGIPLLTRSALAVFRKSLNTINGIFRKFLKTEPFQWAFKYISNVLTAFSLC